MSWSVFEDRERKCPVCGKAFLKAPENIYKLTVKGVVTHYCSYTCYRAVQKRQERGKKTRRRV